MMSEMESFPDNFCVEQCGFVPRNTGIDYEASLRNARASIAAMVQAARRDHAKCAIIQISPDGSVRPCMDIHHARALTELDSRLNYRVDIAHRVRFIKTLYDELRARFGNHFKTIQEPDGSTMVFMSHVPDAPVGPEFAIEFP